MSREALNKSFLLTSFLDGANAAYIEEIHAQYNENPGSVGDEWRHFFESLQEGQGEGQAEITNPSWAVPLEKLQTNGDLVAALTGDYAGVERTLQDKLQARSNVAGMDLSPVASLRATQDSIRALMLIRAYRVIGHFAADLDPLELAEPRVHNELQPETYGFTQADLDRPIFIDNVLGLETATVRQIIRILQRTYCRHIGVEFMHITTPAQKSWIQHRIEGEEKDINFTIEGKKAILNKLIEAEAFEKFCDVKYTGTKRFGIDGGEAMAPALEQIIKRGGQLGVKEIVMGMAHRGRLNVLANVMGKPHRAIFNEFKGGSFKPDDVEGSGDVKYHLGASSDRSFDNNNVHLSLTANPSHLEIVDPVVLGKVRAKQDQHGCDPNDRTAVLPLLIHGDAAFAGQGVVAECFGLSGLKGHRTGGSLHFVINNQIGFTTNPRHSRSSPYCSDVARMIEAPIFHVNGDNPEAVVHVAKIATEFRQKFQKPVVIDMFCYRRYGHNESDEPMFTQPRMYKRIKKHTPVAEKYSTRLVEEGVMSANDVDEMRGQFRAHLDSELQAADAFKPNKADWLDGRWSSIGFAEDEARRGKTGVDEDVLLDIGQRITKIPTEFQAHKTVKRLLDKRREMVETGVGIDWGMAEHLAFGSLVNEGFPVRLSGQDCKRGTFSQRHSVLVDQETAKSYTPLRRVSPDQARFEVINSMLSEEAVLGFEYGYSLAEPNSLVMWEGQFGDFANGAQVIFDQFLSSGERKWLRMSGLVCLLPHGYEGQGPEHSSARLERFLQMSAEDNWQVANCTTPANYFHILRRQLHRKFRKPLILMTPKSLLRHKRVISNLKDLGPDSTFHRVLWDDEDQRLNGSGNQTDGFKLAGDDAITRVVLCTGKVYYDLLDERNKQGLTNIYLMRVEQLYPFPARTLITELGRFPNLQDVVWCQEEPKNMGSWTFIEPNIEWVLNHVTPGPARPSYVGRPASASTATGQLSKHLHEQKTLVAEALTT
ncbi:MAG: 2-oxoglutarate dehydrogenase E1 component [Pseudomonadota bacterium]